VTTGPIETELKFSARDAEPLHALSRMARLGPAQLGEELSVDEIDRYLDTADLRLAAHRWACRLRERRGRVVISLKGPAEQAAGDHLHLRPEVEGPGGSGVEPEAWPPSPARELLIRLADGASLRERFRLEQRRGERPVSLDGAQIGLLSLDRVRVIHGGAEVGLLLAVELELSPAALAAGLDPGALEAALATVPGLVPDPKTKLEHALALLRES
jgi:inorganic triphosphatase YgiF